MFLTFIQIYRGVIAVPNIRGGNEFGEDWHLGGSLKNKVRFCFCFTFGRLTFPTNRKTASMILSVPRQYINNIIC